MKELLYYLYKVCETALNETHDVHEAMNQMQNLINHYFTCGIYTTKQLYKAQSMLIDIIKCFDVYVCSGSNEIYIGNAYQLSYIFMFAWKWKTSIFRKIEKDEKIIIKIGE